VKMYGMYPVFSWHGKVEGFCEHDDRHVGSIQAGNLLPS
jgi:hypothetical protein